ncbi:hypothetical protein ABLE91_05535 [Aquabacter sp. CN5-332]|uniref:hypothetical protein n=1 Tax=Aquabacter sp. CN5-332 TaxID=3156608 RepID=UPI0032B3DC58
MQDSKARPKPTTRVILDAQGDLVAQAQAADYVLRDGRPRSNLTGARFDGKYYGMKWGANSLRVYPQAPTLSKEQTDA